VLIRALRLKKIVDIRNTKVIGSFTNLNNTAAGSMFTIRGQKKAKSAQKEYNLSLKNDYSGEKYDAVILAVGHREFQDLDLSKLRNGARL
jgi:UDP-N-acetyl-D-galactosamine dehydrogenase